MQPERKSNNPWEISGGADGVLRIGARHVSLAEITGFELSAHQERDILGCLLNYAAYLIVTAVFMIFVGQAGWRERFLLGTLFFAVVGATSLIDIRQANRIRLYRVKIAIGSGGDAKSFRPMGRRSIAGCWRCAAPARADV
jgi:hypothetical protein